MVQIIINDLIPSSVPAEGWKVGYRIKGTTGSYITPTGSPFTTLPIVITTTDPAGTLYEGFIRTDCGGGSVGEEYLWTTPCLCTDGLYSPSLGGNICQKVETVPASISHSGYCVTKAGVGNPVYCMYGSRIYNPGFSVATLFLTPGATDTYIYGNMASFAQWANTVNSVTVGPMNREAVWIDSDCDGAVDALTKNMQVTLSAQFNNTGGIRTIFMGVGGDNQFKVVVNGGVVVDTGTTNSALQFKVWHLLPITILPGVNYFNVIATGDGTQNDAIAMVIYDNTAAELMAATADAQLNIIFKSSTLNGRTIDVATCTAGYSLDTSGGSGSYICTRTLLKACNSLS